MNQKSIFVDFIVQKRSIAHTWSVYAQGWQNLCIAHHGTAQGSFVRLFCHNKKTSSHGDFSPRQPKPATWKIIIKSKKNHTLYI